MPTPEQMFEEALNARARKERELMAQYDREVFIPSLQQLMALCPERWGMIRVRIQDTDLGGDVTLNTETRVGVRRG